MNPAGGRFPPSAPGLVSLSPGNPFPSREGTVISPTGFSVRMGRADSPFRRPSLRRRALVVGVLGTGAVLLLSVFLPGAAPLLPRGNGSTGGTPLPSPGARALACGGTPGFSISATPSSGIAPLTVAFKSNVTGGCPPYELEWEFGDGGEATGASPSHVFKSAGTFPVQAQVQDSNGSRAFADTTVVVTGGSGTVSVSIEALPTQPAAGSSVTLWANATGGNLSSSFITAWAFGDGGQGSGSPISHTYTTPGTYTVSAMVRDGYGHSGTGSLGLTVAPGGTPAGPNLSLSAAPDGGNAPLNVTIVAYSNGLAAADGLIVCFGDGPTCATGPVGWSGATPFTFTHVYNDAGNFTVTGTLTNVSGFVVAGATVAIEVAPPSAVVVDGSLVPAEGTSPLTVALVTTVSGGTAPYTVQWSFGDGAVGSSIPGEPVQHTYTEMGRFVPTVTVTDSAGHTTNFTLGSVIVTEAESFAGLPATYLGVPTGLLVGLALGGALAVGIVVGRYTRRRRQQELQQEGEELVREMEQET